jgi:putative ABC transport system ATP-binding protein
MLTFDIGYLYIIGHISKVHLLDPNDREIIENIHYQITGSVLTFKRLPMGILIITFRIDDIKAPSTQSVDKVLRYDIRQVVSTGQSEVLGMSRIHLSDLDKVYRTGKTECHALKSINLTIEQGELVAIVGPSGSGKSTILNMITGIDRPSNGHVFIGEHMIDQMKEDALARWRGRNIGIVFQFFQLFPTLTALENAMLPLDLAKKGTVKERRAIARRNLELVGLGDKLDNLPSELSGGEQQRVAIARALANEPGIIIGDEPTGNLDTETAERMFEILRRLNQQGKTIIYVTHNRALAERAGRTVRILDGRIMTN